MGIVAGTVATEIKPQSSGTSIDVFISDRSDFSATYTGARRGANDGTRWYAAQSCRHPSTSDAPGTNALASLTPVKEKKTAEELASMIRQDVSEVDACPSRGVNVTVYGLNPWNSMLTFGVDAGPVHNKAYLQSFCDIITEGLKRLDDI